MGMDVRVSGGNQLASLARDLKAAGDRELRKEMLAGIRKAAKPLAKEVAPNAAREGLPKRGGLNEYVASSSFTVRTRTSGKDVGVRVVGAKKPKHDLAGLDRGVVRHKVFGRWVKGLPPQRIRPGWWTDAMSDEVVLAPMRRELIHVLDDVKRQVGRGR